MNSLKSVYELIDISSSEDEEGLLERGSKPLPREPVLNYRVVIKTFRSTAEAVADEDGYFDVLADSLELNCKRMRLDSNAGRADSGDLVETQEDEGLPDSPESPDESLNSEVFIVKKSS